MRSAEVPKIELSQERGRGRRGAHARFLVIAALFAVGCGPTILDGPTMLDCQSDSATTITYPQNEARPYVCVAYDKQMLEVDEKAVETAREAVEMQAEQEREEKLRPLLAESPVQSEDGLRHDLEQVNKLTPSQVEALRDLGNNVTLTADEQKALTAMSQDQWHAVTQLAAFFDWLKKKADEEHQAEEQAIEAVEREQDRARSALYESLMAEAAARQANAAEWQAATLQRQQRCLHNLSFGMPCF